MFAPNTDLILTAKSQITFLQYNDIDKIFSVVTYVANATHIIPTLSNLPVTVPSRYQGHQFCIEINN